MSGDWCLVVRPRQTASAAEIDGLSATVRAEEGRLQLTRENDDILVVVADASWLSQTETAMRSI